MKELVAVDSTDELLILPQRKVRLHGIEFDEDFLSALVAKHLTKKRWQTRPKFSDAYDIYMRENPSAHRRKFRIVAQHAYSLFVSQFGDVALDDLRHAHITQFRDCQLARGLHPNSVRRHINMLNAMLNMAFKHLDIDRLSPFRGLYIRGEGELSRTIAPISLDHLRKVKAHLLDHPIESRLAALIQLNSGMRISEPVLARLEDLVLDHDIPHLWVRPNQLTQRKTQASIRCVP
jgi:integrase